MCGINGFNWPDEEMIANMNIALRHRGPDGEGMYVDDHVSLGHRRLAIIDLSEKAKQPMSNEDGSIWLVYNGEIYNFRELRQELEQKGHQFKSRTDTEVVLHAYEEWQSKCLDRFNGMFAFAIYESATKKLFLARDRFGIKPLYYHSSNGIFIFSSEIKGILCHGIERKTNDKSICEYLSFNLLQHSSDTFFNKISKLLPGHYLVYNLADNSSYLKEWYQFPATSAVSICGKNQRLEEIKNLSRDSIRKRLVADVPVGSCLSGGLDSSFIVCTMRDFLPGDEIKTYSSVFPGEPIDEGRYINEVAISANTNAYFVSPTAEELLDDLRDLVNTQEEPFTGPSVYAQYRVMKLAHENGQKVLLDGQGGDELFAGYSYYFGFYFYELLTRLRWYALLRELIGYRRHSRDWEPIQMLAFLLLPSWAKRPLWQTKVQWLNNKLNHSHSRSIDDPRWLVKSLNEGLLLTLTRTAIPHLLIWEDKNSMRWSIESRLPFLDYRLVELANSLPSEDKLSGGVTKYIFRQAANGCLPEKIKSRKDKIGFAVPEDKWLKHPRILEFTRDLITSSSFRQRPYWQQEEVEKHYKSYITQQKASPQNARNLWKWLSLELWLRQFID